MTFGVAKEATTASAGNNGACSDGRSGENERNSSERSGSRDGTKYGGSSKKGPVCDGSGLWEELLCMWRIWAHGPQL